MTRLHLTTNRAFSGTATFQTPLSGFPIIGHSQGFQMDNVTKWSKDAAQVLLTVNFTKLASVDGVRPRPTHLCSLLRLISIRTYSTILRGQTRMAKAWKRV